jgi:hypothetical protein
MKRMNMIKYQHRIGGYLTEFHNFVESVFLHGVYQEEEEI